MAESEVDLDKVLRAYARIKALRDNLPGPIVSEAYVGEFHDALGNLTQARLDIDEFRVPDSAVTYRWFPGGARRVKSDKRYVDREFMLTKVDAALLYLDLLLKLTPEPPRELGFGRG